MSVADSYLALLEQVRESAMSAGRDPSSITLVAVSKGYPLDHILPAFEAGCRDFGESKIQEAFDKIAQGPEGVRWHLIGTLQKNKVGKAVGQFALIHSVDSLELAQKISQTGFDTRILLQVNTSGEKTKHGFTPDDLLSHIDKLASLPGVRIEGLMTMAPFVDDQIIIRKCFSDLRVLRDRLQGRHPSIKELSMGMSHDYKIAIEEGATILRIGTAIFGK